MSMQLRRSSYITAAAFLSILVWAGCDAPKSSVTGRVFAPPGITPGPQYAKVSLCRQPKVIQRHLAEHVKFAALACLNADRRFVQHHRKILERLAEIKAARTALAQGAIATSFSAPPDDGTAFLSIDDLLSAIEVTESRVPSARERRTIERRDQRLMNEASEIAAELLPSLKLLREERNQYKDTIVDAVGEMLRENTVASTPLRSDGTYLFRDVSKGNYVVVSHYKLYRTFVSERVSVAGGRVSKDIGEPPPVLRASRVVSSLEILIRNTTT